MYTKTFILAILTQRSAQCNSLSSATTLPGGQYWLGHAVHMRRFSLSSLETCELRVYEGFILTPEGRYMQLCSVVTKNVSLNIHCVGVVYMV